MIYFTMVARSGDAKNGANMMNYTLIGSDLSVKVMRGDKLAAAIADEKIKVTNLAVSVKGLVSTNGAMNKYTTIGPDGNLVGTARSVILNRVEKGGKLHSYIIFNANGVVSEIDVPHAAVLAQKGLIANGKIRHTEDGDIVSSINGTYPLVEKVESKEKEKITTDVILYGSAIKGTGKGSTCKYVGIIINSNKANTISKLYPKLVKESENLKKKLAETFGYTEDELKGFAIKQSPGAGIYGVYPFATAVKLMTLGKTKYNSGKIVIGCKDCGDSDNAESFIVYDTKKKTVIASQEGTEKSDAKLKEYSSEIISSMDN